MNDFIYRLLINKACDDGFQWAKDNDIQNLDHCIEKIQRGDWLLWVIRTFAVSSKTGSNHDTDGRIREAVLKHIEPDLNRVMGECWKDGDYLYRNSSLGLPWSDEQVYLNRAAIYYFTCSTFLMIHWLCYAESNHKWTAELIKKEYGLIV